MPHKRRLYDPVAAALAEDLGSGDLTSEFFIPFEERSSGGIIAKQSCVVAGLSTAREVFLRVDPDILVHVRVQDGAAVEPGEVVMIVEGRARSLLSAERTALNFIQRLSGVATLTRAYVQRVEGTGVKILDTRKTTPGLRLLEKAAVRAGGGVNHRMGLYDAVMVKDNHLTASNAVERLAPRIEAFRKAHPGIPVIVEADTLELVRALCEIPGIDRILLDNMDCEQLRASVAATAGRVPLEASGGVTLTNVREIAETGVDFISIGALTHSAPAVDFSLELQHSEA